MPPALNIQAHSQFLETWHQALASPNGLLLEVTSRDRAIELRSRLYYARKAQCRENKKIYPFGHPLHGNSAFDKFRIRLVEESGRVFLRIEETEGIDVLGVSEL